jgi:hypothetical protein
MWLFSINYAIFFSTKDVHAIYIEQMQPVITPIKKEAPEGILSRKP